MGNLVLVTGGSGSGKSSFAEKIATEAGKDFVYVATAVGFDDEMKDRIARHQKQRGATFITLERYKDFNTFLPSILEYDGILVDCLTMMITNLMMDYLGDRSEPELSDVGPLEALIQAEIDTMMQALCARSKKVVIVTNELGMGIVPMNFFSRLFRDISGRANQWVAQKSDTVYWVVSGIPLKIK